MIEVLFSHEFDSGVWTGPKPSEWGSVGQAALGELGFLDLLETQLGLKQPESISYQRKIDYLQPFAPLNRHSDFILSHSKLIRWL